MGRMMVAARRLRRGQAGRLARRAGRIAGRALVYGVAPSLMADSMVDHHAFDVTLVAHDVAANAFVTAVATSAQDVMLLMRTLR